MLIQGIKIPKKAFFYATHLSSSDPLFHSFFLLLSRRKQQSRVRYFSHRRSGFWRWSSALISCHSWKSFRIIPIVRNKFIFRWLQNCSGFEDREEGHIASIWLTSDLQKMGCYDGRKNMKLFLTIGISCFKSAALALPNSQILNSLGYIVFLGHKSLFS